jgi:hypothetical protein
MPDLAKPPLHALPHDALVAKLKALTNLRAAGRTCRPGAPRVESGGEISVIK